MRIRLLLAAVCGLLAGTALAMGVVPALNEAPASADTNSWWQKKHAAKLAEIKERGEDARIVFYGDSITELWEWEQRGKPVWNEHFAEGRFKALEFGYSGDCTQNLLWRIKNGEGEGLKPGVVVLQIGTNNSWLHPDWSAIDTILAVKEILGELRSRFPEARFILCAVPPCGEKKDDFRRVKNDVINPELQKLSDGKEVFFLDWEAKALDYEGNFDPRYTYDFVHPTTDGYRLWYAALEPYLEKFLPDPEGTPRTVVPATRMREEWWAKRLLERSIQNHANTNHVFDLVMCGDSITHFWETRFPELWKEQFKDFKVLNLGYSGDRTEHLLWRLKYGELDGYKARNVSVMIGTNNTGDSAEDVAEGVRQVLAVIREKQPEARILLLPIFPRSKAGSDVRRKNDATNAVIKGFADGEKVVLVDINSQLQNEDGSITPEMFPDALHPARPGYEIWFKALQPYLGR